jgi:rare lipoprotein A (peptidoglycan hydrolase)
MRQFLIAILPVLFFSNPSIAQDKSLIVQGATPDLYLVHVILPKENYYSVGRMYNIPPKELGTYNNLPFEKGLSLGQSIKIPLTQNNFSQGEPAKKEEALVPVYHIVQPKEGLYHISVSYNRVPPELLKKWNNLPGEVVSNGARLIIGYLKVLKEQSPLAQKGVTMPKTDVVTVPKEEKKEVVKPEIIKEKPATTAKTKKEKENSIVSTSKETKPEKIEQKEIQPEKAEQKETKPEKDEPKEEMKTSSDKPAVNFSGGYFKKLYNSQTDNKSIVKENGLAGVFKTTSGWTDGKYYCFHNIAPPGTVIKITNPGTGKSVYAKVLDAVPDIKQNNGLLLRLSNSAAEELGAGETKFDCAISYTK